MNLLIYTFNALTLSSDLHTIIANIHLTLFVDDLELAVIIFRDKQPFWDVIIADVILYAIHQSVVEYPPSFAVLYHLNGWGRSLESVTYL